MYQALLRIVEYEEARPKLVSEGITNPIVQLLGADNLEVELTVIRLAARLAAHPKNHLRMVRDGILKPLFAIIRSQMKSVGHKKFAMAALAELCTSPDNHRKVCEDQGMQTIVGMVAFYSEDVRPFAAVACERLCDNPSLSRALVEEGLLSHLVPMLKSGKYKMQLTAACALSALAENRDNSLLIVREGGLIPLIRLSRCGKDDLEAAAGLGLARVAKNPINRPKLLFHGGFKPLIYNAQYGATEEVRDTCMDVLASLFKTSAHRKDELVRKAAEKFKSGMKKYKKKKSQADEFAEGLADSSGKGKGGGGRGRGDSDEEGGLPRKNTWIRRARGNDEEEASSSGEDW